MMPIPSVKLTNCVLSLDLCDITKKICNVCVEMHEQCTKNTTGIIVPFNFVPFNFVSKSSMSWHCFEIKRSNMHVSEFLNAKCLVEVTHP